MKCLLTVLVALALGGRADATVLLNGSGSTFAAPLYMKWGDVFHERERDITINYGSIGSGAGIANISAGATDFGATDGPMTDEQLAALPVPILHLPTAIGAVVITFNVNHIDRLRFDPETIAGIFLGKITNWKDPALRRLNSVPLPGAPITTVHRADGSGTTYIFADYLSKVSPEWQSTIGRGTSVKWPGGLAANGNEGVADLVQHTENSIGYVGLLYSVKHDLPYGGVRNRAGNFVLPSLETVTNAAAAAAKSMPPDLRVSISDADGPGAYPISSFTWLLVPSRIADVHKGEALKKFLEWMIVDGQTLAPQLLYAPLPTQAGLSRSALASTAPASPIVSSCPLSCGRGAVSASRGLAGLI
jgi:phosphate transport system substrate-binding protein